MSSGGQRRESTERETLENDVRLKRGKYSFHLAQMEAARHEMEAAEAKLMAFAMSERAEMARAAGIEPAGM